MTSSVLLGRNFLRAFGIFLSIAETNSNKIQRPKIEINSNKEKNKIRIDEQTLHCVYSSLGDESSDLISECELCRYLPNAYIANCNSVSKIKIN